MPTGKESPGSLRRRAALAAAGWLVLAGLVLPFSLSFAAGLTRLESSPRQYVLAALIVLVGASAGGAGFGHALARLAGARDRRRMAWAAGLAYGPAAIAAGILLGLAEPAALRVAASTGVPIHVLFGLLFVPATGCVAAVLALGLGWALGSRRLGAELAWKAGVAAALAFPAADVLQDLLGRRVGAPGAAATATMLTVALVGLLAAAAATGAVMAPILGRHAAAQPAFSGEPGGAAATRDPALDRSRP